MIIVTGSNGFIGKNLVESLDGSLFLVDKDDKEAVFNIDWATVTHVYHMGAISDTTEKDVDLIYRNNIDYSIRLFEKAIQNKTPVTYASSASVYGTSQLDHINPLNYYAMSKATLDLWVADNIDRFELIRGYRFFNVYGKHEDHKGSQASPVYQFTRQARENGTIKVFENTQGIGDGERDFIWVGDVVRVMTTDTRPSGIYNLGTGKTMRFSELAKLIAQKYNAAIEEIPFPKHLVGKYQYYTCAYPATPNCISVEDYINDL